MKPPDPAGPPLAGRLVVDLSSGIAGAYCTRLLSDGGADVVKVEPPEGDPLRSWSASGASIPYGEDGALFSFLAGGKRSVVADPGCADDLAMVAGLLDAADAVVWSPGGRLAECAALAPARIRRSHPGLTVTAITPFGLEGPWRDRPATEFTLQAWSGGIIGLGRGRPDRAPVHVGGRPGDWLSGAYAAAGTMISWLRRGERPGDPVGGLGELVDVSMLETHVLCFTYYPVTFFEQLGRPWRTDRSVFMPGVSEAEDGLVALGCGTAQQWFDLCAMVGHPEWIDDRPLSITERAIEFAPLIKEWIAGRTVAEVVDLATAFRIPCAPVGDGANVPAAPHFQARRSFRTNARDGFTEPDHPYRLKPDVLRRPGPAPRLGEHTAGLRPSGAAPDPVKAAPGLAEAVSGLAEAEADRVLGGGGGIVGAARPLPFEGLRVLDMTAFWAGPSCTHVLAMLGAEVIHLESASRPDGTRLIAGVPATEDSWWERSPIFSGLNAGKKSLDLDIRQERGRELLRGLIPACDVVVESFTPRVVEQAGLGYDAVRALRPDVIMVRMPGFGLDGPWRDGAAFAYVIEGASGLTWLTGHPDDPPVEPYSLGDPAAGLHALNALLLALEHRRRTGEGMLVEAAMVDAALNVAAEQVIEYSAYGALLRRDGNRGPAAAPQNLYRTADVDEFGRDDTWVAIAVASDGQWAALCDALGRPGWSARLATADGRRAEHDEIDAVLAAWCRARDADEIVRLLADAGVPVGRVMQPHRQAELAPLSYRGFFEVVDHPVAGPARHSTLPIRFSGVPGRLHRGPAPLLGEHNEELLGFGPEEIGGRAPDMGGNG
jgi:crotonobetainyl-CoA:carnitine CoA-transferase CaiB-like acyl-CoA transferase